MPRGITPRQPSRSGRQDKASNAARSARERIVKTVKPSGSKTRPTKAALSGTTSGTSPKRSGKPVKSPTKSSRKTAIVTKGYNPIAPERVNAILEGLDARYPDVVCALHHRSAWELLVATILSAQCTDVRVNLVTPGLFEKYPTPEAFAALQPEDLEDDIRSTGFFRNKSKSLVGRGAQNHQRLRRRRAAHHGRTADHSGRRAQNRQRCARLLVQDRRRRGGRHACTAHLAPSGADEKYRAREDRAGPDASDPARPLDPVLPPDHSPRPRNLYCAPSEVRPSARWRHYAMRPIRPGARWRFTSTPSRNVAVGVFTRRCRP